MKDYKYCPMCGSPLVGKLAEERHRLVCGNCNWIYYKNPVPVIACLVSNTKDELLLIKRAIEPYKGEWCIPGGFMEFDETLSEAGSRELKEETGLEGKAGRLIGAHAQPSWMYGAVLVVGIEFLVESEKTIAGDDAEEAEFMPLDALPEIPIESHRKLIEEYLSAV